MKAAWAMKTLRAITFVFIRLLSCGCLILRAADPGTRVIAWGDNDNGQIDVPEGLTNAIYIVGGASNSLAIRADGTVVVWGDNSFGQTNVPFTMTKTVA